MSIKEELEENLRILNKRKEKLEEEIKEGKE